MNVKKDKKNKNISNKNSTCLESKNTLLLLTKKYKKLKNKLLNIQQNNQILFNKCNTQIYKKIDLVHKFSLEKIIISILPILDSLEIACQSIKNFPEYNKIYQKLLKNNIFFINILLKNNIKIIDTTNIPFDPAIHQAMFLKSTKSVQKNYVVEVMQKGYLLHNRLLRPAMVSVSSD